MKGMQSTIFTVQFQTGHYENTPV